MRPRTVLYYIAVVLLVSSALMLVSAGVGALSGGEGWLALLISAAAVGLPAGAVVAFFPLERKAISPRESLAIVVGGWLTVSLTGAVPYLIWGGPFNPVDAIFESASGFTTTGSSILRQVNMLTEGLLFWRAATQWLGGIGMIVLALAIFPSITPVASSLLSGEYPSEEEEDGEPYRNIRSVSRMKELARIILYLYGGLTLAMTVLLMLTGKLNLFESVTHAFCTVSTGGFSVHDANVSAFNSVAVEGITMVFMALSAINFAWLYSLILHRALPKYGNLPVFVFLGVLLGASALVTFQLAWFHVPFGEALRQGFFQVVSVGTTTGFGIVDTSGWPHSSQMLLLILALSGGAAVGSTAGGIKWNRIVIFVRLVLHRLKLMTHARGDIHMVHRDKIVKRGGDQDAVLFIVLYLTVVMVFTVAVSLTGLPLLESFSGSISALGKVGPGLGTIASLHNYADVPPAAKLLFALGMIVGRVEIYGFLLLFVPRFWRAAAEPPGDEK